MRVLVTGMSGVGKTTVVRELHCRGHVVIDTDDGWCVQHADGTQSWDLDRLRPQLEAESLVVAGCEENMVELLDAFDYIVLLVAPLEVLRARVESRTTNDFGKSADEWARIESAVATVEPSLRSIATVVIDTSRCLAAEVADDIEHLLGS